MPIAKIRIERANTPTARVHWRLPNWFYLDVPSIKPKMLDYGDELRQQALWDQKCIQPSKRAS